MRIKVPEISRNGYGIDDESSSESESEVNINKNRKLKSILKLRSNERDESNNKTYLRDDYFKFDELEIYQNDLKNSYNNVISISPSPSTNSNTNDLKFDEELSEINKTLNKVQLDSNEFNKQLNDEFNKRNKSLWNDIEISINLAQNEADKELQTHLIEIEDKRIQEEDLARRHKEKELKVMEETKLYQLERAKQLAIERSQNEVLNYGLKAAETDYNHWYNCIMDIKQNVLPIITEDINIKKSCSASKRKITPKIGQLTNSIQQITRITLEINDVLNEPKLIHGDNSPPYIWLLNHLSKCLIRQAETEVSAKTSTAFPLARLVVSLILGDHQKLSVVLMSRLVKKCCWIIPFNINKHENESEINFKKRLGHKNPDESLVQYNDRMCGILAFYLAILQTKLDNQNLVITSNNSTQTFIEILPPHFRFSASWTWLSHALRYPLPTIPTIPQMIATFFEILGEPYKIAYGKQATKVLQLIKSNINNQSLWAKNSEANITRIKLLLDKWQSSQPLSSDQGKIWEND